MNLHVARIALNVETFALSRIGTANVEKHRLMAPVSCIAVCHQKIAAPMMGLIVKGTLGVQCAQTVRLFIMWSHAMDHVNIKAMLHQQLMTAS